MAENTQQITVGLVADTSQATGNVENFNNALNDTGKAAENASKKVEKANDEVSKTAAEIKTSEGAIKALGGTINLVGGSVELLAGSLAISGAVTDEQAERFEALAVGAIAVADGGKRVLEGAVELSEGFQMLGGTTGIATQATKAFGIATKVAMGPVGIAIAAIGAITTAIVLLKDRFEAVNKVATFFGNIFQKVAEFVGLAATEEEKFADSQKKASEETEFQLKLLQAQGASQEELIKKERKLLKQRVDSFLEGTEERKKAEQELKLFEAKVISDREKAEEDAAQKRLEKIKENAEKRKAAIEAAEAIVNEAELSLLDDQTRELTERETKFQEDLAALKAAGFTDFTALTEAYNQDVAEINENYRQQELDAEAEQTDKLEAERQQRIDDLASADDFLAVTQEDKRALEFQRLTEDFNKKKELFEKNGDSTYELEQAYAARLQELRDKNRDEDEQKEKDYRQALTDLAVDSALGTLSALSDLNSIFDKDNEEAAKRAFNREKALSIAETIIGTYSAAQKAYTSQLIPGDPTSIVRAQIAAGVAIAGGLARLAVISKQQFNGNEASGGTGGVAGGSTSTAGGIITPNAPSTPTPPTPTTAIPTTPSTADPIRAYVLVQDVNSAQQANAVINRRRTLTGG